MKTLLRYFCAISVLFALIIISCKEVDTTPPGISIASPADGMVVKDTVVIKTLASDNDGVSSVEFYVDGELLAIVENEPFQAEWDTKQTTNGSHSLQCKAIDNSGNETLSEAIQVTVANALLTTNFTNDWLCPECGEGIIFISDTAGNVIAEAAWSGNASFDIEAPSNITSFPDKISVTTVTSDGRGNVTITTNLNIPVGFSWTWKGLPFPDWENPVGTAELNFQNIPDHSGYIVSSLWNSRGSNSGTLYSTYSFDIYESPVDIYVKLNTSNAGPQFLWITDVADGSYQVDLANLSSTSTKTIDFSSPVLRFYKYLYGYPVPGSHYTGRYRLDRESGRDTTVTAVNVHYPPSTFTDFRTSLYLYDADESYDFWYQTTYGDIPNTFTKIAADFDYIEVSVDNFHVQPTGTFDQIRSRWKFDDGTNGASWYVYGASDLVQYALPPLPNSVVLKYPFLDRESFELQYADIIDFSGLSSYEEILEVVFNSPDYFYDVVNELRTRVKYYESTVTLQRTRNSGKAFETQNDYELPYLR
ncbi:MAG: hypothetical protein GXO90_02135 [FCB group bacterium]|nr:hypothetical protein [FCB group bacterium]